jgi:hypothetical protein
MRVLSGSEGQARLDRAPGFQVASGFEVAFGSAPLFPPSFFVVYFPPAIRHSDYKPASQVDEAPQVAALGGYRPGVIASSYPETRIV